MSKTCLSELPHRLQVNQSVIRFWKSASQVGTHTGKHTSKYQAINSLTFITIYS